MEDTIIVRDPETAKILANVDRRQILQLLKITDMTPQQIARVLGKNVSSVMHHLSVLEQKGLVKVVRSEVKRNLVVKWYRAAARRIIVSYVLAEGLVPGSSEMVKGLEEASMKAAMELAPNLDMERLRRVAELVRRLYLRVEEKREAIVAQGPRSRVAADPWAREVLEKTLFVAKLFGDKTVHELLAELEKLVGGAHG